jgi:hypothetical protein
MGLLSNLLTAFGPGAQSPGGNQAGGEQIGTLDNSIATSDTDNPTNPAPGSSTQQPQQSGFWQQHPVAAKAISAIFGPTQPKLPAGSPQAPPVQAQPQQQQPVPLGNAVPNAGALLARIASGGVQQGGNNTAGTILQNIPAALAGGG